MASDMVFRIDMLSCTGKYYGLSFYCIEKITMYSKYVFLRILVCMKITISLYCFWIKKTCVIPKLSLIPHTLRDITSTANFALKAQIVIGLHDMWVIVQGWPEDHLFFLLKLKYLVATLATIYGNYLTIFVNKQRRLSQCCLCNTILILQIYYYLNMHKTAGYSTIKYPPEYFYLCFRKYVCVCFSLKLSLLLTE